MAKLLGISRANVYYLPKAESDADPAQMRRIDELHLERPFAGARMLRDMLPQERWQVGRKRVATLMKKMGIQALYRKPNTSKRHAAHTIYPYLLRRLPRRICRQHNLPETNIDPVTKFASDFR